MKVYVELLSNNWLMFDSDTNKLHGRVAHGQHSLQGLQADSDVYILHFNLVSVVTGVFSIY